MGINGPTSYVAIVKRTVAKKLRASGCQLMATATAGKVLRQLMLMPLWQLVRKVK
jgi:hypothetical protein